MDLYSILLNTRIGNFLYIIYIYIIYIYIIYLSLAVSKRRVVRPGRCTPVDQAPNSKTQLI